MDPEFLIPIAALVLSAGVGTLLGRSGRVLWTMILSVCCLGAAYILMFHSQILGWDGMGPGIVAIVGVIPVAFGIAAGGFTGRWLSTHSEPTAPETDAQQNWSPQTERQDNGSD